MSDYDTGREASDLKRRGPCVIEENGSLCYDVKARRVRKKGPGGKDTGRNVHTTMVKKWLS